MALEGSIQDFGLPDIIQFLRQQNKTGVLTIEGPNSWTKISFEGGMIVSVTTSETQEADWIGKRLIRSERITEARFKEAIKHKHKAQGKIETALVETGLVSRQELTSLLDLQIKETLFALFRLSEGRYRFEAVPVSYNQEYVTPIDAEFVLLEGMRQLDEWPLIEKEIPNQKIIFDKNPNALGKVKVKGLVERALDEELLKGKPAEEGFTITSEEKAVYNLVDGQRDLKKLIDMAQIGEFYTCKALTNLLSLGLIIKREEFSAPEKKPATAQSLPRVAPTLLHSTKLWNSLMIMLLGIWVFATGSKLIESFTSPLEMSRFFEQELSQQKRIQLEEAALVYYLRTSHLPESLNELAANLHGVASLVEGLKGRGVHYRIVEDGFVIDLDRKP